MCCVVLYLTTSKKSDSTKPVWLFLPSPDCLFVFLVGDDLFLQVFFRRMAKDAVLFTCAFFVGLPDTVVVIAVAWDIDTETKKINKHQKHITNRQMLKYYCNGVHDVQLRHNKCLRIKCKSYNPDCTKRNILTFLLILSLWSKDVSTCTSMAWTIRKTTTPIFSLSSLGTEGLFNAGTKAYWNT